MEDQLSEAYHHLMDGYSDEVLSTIMPIVKEDGSIVILSASGYYNNGEAAFVASQK